MDTEQRLPAEIQELVAFIGDRIFENPVVDGVVDDATTKLLNFALDKIGDSTNIFICSHGDYYVTCGSDFVIFVNKESNKMKYISGKIVRDLKENTRTKLVG